MLVHTHVHYPPWLLVHTDSHPYTRTVHQGSSWQLGLRPTQRGENTRWIIEHGVSSHLSLSHTRPRLASLARCCVLLFFNRLHPTFYCFFPFPLLGVCSSPRCLIDHHSTRPAVSAYLPPRLNLPRRPLLSSIWGVWSPERARCRCSSISRSCLVSCSFICLCLA